jgi:hypothetical protein
VGVAILRFTIGIWRRRCTLKFEFFALLGLKGRKLMKAGNKGFHWSMMALLLILVFVAGGNVQAQTQTPTATCANDSLLLLSPDAVIFNNQIQGRVGLEISWEDMDLEEATCFALVGDDTLDYPVDVQGGFGDQVDRQLVFTLTDTSVVGSTGPETLLMTWATEGSTIYGVLAGTINLANNGGIYHFDESGGSWGQLNESLPLSWPQTNTVALASGSDGFLVGAFSSGQTMGSKPRGLYVNGDFGWQIIGEDIFTSTVNITKVEVSPHNNDHFAVGTRSNGLFVTTDGGETFVQWTDNLDSDFDPAPLTVQISSLAWSDTRIWTFAPNFGLFYSDDNGGTFHRSFIEVDEDLDSPGVFSLPLNIYDIVVDSSDEDHVLLCMQFHGVFQTTDGGLNWTDTYGDMQIVDPDDEGAWTYTAASVLIDPNDSNLWVAGMKNKGLYRTTNAGTNWTLVGADVAPENLSTLSEIALLPSDGTVGLYYCLMDQWSMLVSSDLGTTWEHLSEQPMLSKGVTLAPVRDGSGSFFMGSWGGGIFIKDIPIALSDTYNSTTTSNLRDLDLGLEITIGEGDLLPGDQFTLKCQTFQGWAVWRASGHEPEEMILIGLFDRVNPESCIEGYCGNMNWEIVPQCYNSKRAACFNFDTPDTVRFFDEEIYNGFTYYYAVTSYDYGNTALTSPQNSSVTPIYSPRWTGDLLSPYGGSGNRTQILMNDEPTGDAYGEDIYVYPNPLRLDTGFPGEEGERVIFTKLPEGSRVRIFTTSGDDVINLGPDNLFGGNIDWWTRNREGEPVSPGVYLYKVEMPSREDFWGKLVIIR